jgi:hypothetical protein
MGGVAECIHPLLNSTLDAGDDTFIYRQLYSFTMRLGGHQTWSGLFGYEKKPVSLQEIETRFLGHPRHYLVTTPTTDSLRAGRSGNRIPVGARFSAPVQTQPPIRWISGLSLRKSGRGLASTTHHHLASRLKKEYSYNYSPSGPSWSVVGWTSPFTLPLLHRQHHPGFLQEIVLISHP